VTAAPRDGTEHREVGMHRPTRRVAILAAVAATLATATIGAAVASPGHVGQVAKSDSALHHVKFYAFDINDGGADPGFIAAPGTSATAFSQGDELILNDQLTVTHKVGSGYPIIGHDAGVCTLTRRPEKFAEQTFANCVVTAVLKNGSLTLQGLVRFKAKQPQPGTLAVTGGTGHYTAAAGTAAISYRKNFKVVNVTLK
jgi:dirigent-like protein